MKRRIATFGAANLFGALLGMLGSLWAANLAGPSLMGVINSLQLSVIYAPLLLLGIYNGLNRELPFSIGAGKREEADRLAAVALFVCGVVSFIIFIVMLFSAWGAWYFAGWTWFVGVCVFAVILPPTLYRLYLEVTFRTSHDFVWLSIVKLITAIAGLAFILLMYLDLWGGMLARALLTVLLGTFLLWIKRPFRVVPIWDKTNFMRLIAVGLPIFIVGYLYLFLTNMDRLFIVLDIDSDALGAYTPALLILQGMAILPMSVAQVIYPRIAEHYGREGSIHGLSKLLFMPVPILLIVQLPFVWLGWIYMDELIRYFMPQFEQGIAAARWSLLVGLVFSLTAPTVVFNVVRRQDIYALIILASIFLVFVTWKLNEVNGIVGMATAMLFGGLCFSTLSVVGAWHLIMKDKYESNKKAHT